MIKMPFWLWFDSQQENARLLREADSQAMLDEDLAELSAAPSSGDCEPSCNCATYKRGRYVFSNKKNTAGDSTSYRTERTANGFKSTLHRQKCLKKACAAAAKVEAWKRGNGLAGILTGAAHFLLRKESRMKKEVTRFGSHVAIDLRFVLIFWPAISFDLWARRSKT